MMSIRRMELTARVKRQGGGVRAVWLRSGALPARVTIFVHGFKNSEYDADNAWRQTHELLRPLVSPSAAASVAHYYWPGDRFENSVGSALWYFKTVGTAVECGESLADWIARAALQRNEMVVQFVGHSLGCRVVLEAVTGLAGNPRVRVGRVILMAAAVPEGLCHKGGTLPGTTGPEELVLYSRADCVLKMVFPPGQWLARHPFNDPTPARGKWRAVGYTGGPNGRWHRAESSGYKHGGYWNSDESVRRIARLLDTKAPQVVPFRVVAARCSPVREVLSHVPLIRWVYRRGG